MPDAANFHKLLGILQMSESFVHFDATVTDEPLQCIRREFEASGNPFDRLSAICSQIGATTDVELRRALMQLRDEFETQALTAKISEIEQTFEQSPDDGWTTWLTVLAEAVFRFRHGFAAGLCKHMFPFDSTRKQVVKQLRRAVECMRQSRWEETYEEVAFLSKQECLPVLTRARLVTIRAQIELFRFQDVSRARPLFQEAATIAPDDGWIFASFGDYWLSEKEPERAGELYQRAIELAPKNACGYVGMGDRFEKDGHFDEAEAWYRKAITLAGGDVLGYDRLLRLLGRPINLETRENDFLAVLEKKIAVDPEAEYDTYLAVGGYYLAANRVSDARGWYEKAIRLETNWPHAYTELAELCRTQEENERAETLYKKAIELARECPSGYIGLSRIYEQGSRWQDALRVYEAFPQRPRQWVSFARASVGRMHAKLGDYVESERVLFDGLRNELPSQVSQRYAQSALEDIASEHYRQRSDKESAKRIYDEILQVLGNHYTDRYHNMLGNLHYYFGDYGSAADEYRKAIKAAPDNATYHRYLSNTYESLGEYETADSEVENAYLIDKDEKRLKEQKASLANAQGNRSYESATYSEAVKHYTNAARLDPLKAVYHANLALAFERVKETGNRVHFLEQAARSYERAQEILKSQHYTEEIARLRRRAAVGRAYGEKALDYVNVATPIAVEVASDLIAFIEGAKPGTLSDELASSVTDMRTQVKEELGVGIPGIRFRGNETDLPDGTYIVMINEIPLVSGNLSLDRQFCPGPEQILSALDVKSERVSDPVSGKEGFWIDRKDWHKVKSQKLELWGITRNLMRHVEAVVRKNISEFLGHQELINLLNGESEAAVTEIRVSSRMISALTSVCKALLAEEVPICPFHKVCAIFKELYEKNVALRDIVERIRLMPIFRERLPGNDRQHSYVRLSTGFEAEIRRATYERDGQLILAMEPERCQNVLTAVRNAVRNRPFVLVVEDSTLRVFVRKLVELEFPDLPVLSRAELRSDADILQTEMIELDDEPSAEKVQFRNTRDVDAIVAHSELGRAYAELALSDIRVEVFVGEDFDTEGSVADDKPFAEMLSTMQDDLFYELGLILPEVQLRTDRNLKSGEFRIRLNGLEQQPIAELGHDEFMVNDTVDRLTLLGIEGREAVNPANGSECAFVHDDQGQAETCKQAGLTAWGARGYLVLKLSADIWSVAAQFQTEDLTQYNLDSLGQAFPDLVRSALEHYTLPQISLLLQELLDEQISIRDLRSILEILLSIDGTTDVDLNRFIVFFSYADALCPAMAARNVSDLTTTQLADFVRACLRRYISYKYTRAGNTLVVYLLDPAIEKRITDIGAQPLTEQENAKLQAALAREVRNILPSANSPVLLTSFEVRRALRKIIQHRFPRLAVLSYQELSPDLNIQPITRISWD